MTEDERSRIREAVKRIAVASHRADRSERLSGLALVFSAIAIILSLLMLLESVRQSGALTW